ncbi:ABC transporter substrate-binding protein [Vibrio alginolyticus]|uniref:ABC transporter substrate-binding protein n=1 Tax=Vibrio sp. B1FLJ16 TaxID=2751178 RepID=UPI0015F609DB|nr:ABC transporter substrate-binding protein [Vibrio sp. B1FLJ16]CAD7805233.1 Bacterial extracellular solute-binding proteins [Vibrio sp. B1FLJ16]CAE6900250.1 Bacterial extracellular solute-binding proteins [Vibrio sp. B1FLJ16]
MKLFVNKVRRLAGLTSLALAVSSGAALAATPKDSLVVGWQFDDIITLDTAEVFEFSGAEIVGNSYDRLIGYDPDDVSKIFGVAAESWTVSDDGKTFTFKMRKGIKFTSGDEMNAEDAAFSLQRAIILNKTPAFILTQFGFTADNVKDKIKAVDSDTLVLETDKSYAPTFVLYCLSSTIASIVDKDEVMKHEVDGDMGFAWLRTNYAGSGPFKIEQWKPSEIVVLSANKDYWDGAPKVKNVFIRHIGESSVQQLLLEKGDIDIARNLETEQLKSVSDDEHIKLLKKGKGALYYLSMNLKDPILAKPKVQEALKYLIDYKGLEDTVWSGRGQIQQAFLPKGFLGALEDQPFSLDVEKAKKLLAEAGYPDGFEMELIVRNAPIRIDTAKSIQTTFAKAGINIKLIPMDGKQVLTVYRARKHQLFFGAWGPDYQDPHTNADTFAKNLDNSDDAKSKPVAWRNAYAPEEMTKDTLAAVLESDAAKRASMYMEIQKEHQQHAPFAFIMQEQEVAGIRDDVEGYVLGPSFDSNSYKNVVKK